MTNQTPDHLPPVPDGYVYAGEGDQLPGKENDGSWQRLGRNSRKWSRTYCTGVVSQGHHYAVPTDSYIGRKILADRDKPDWKDAPDWAEWLAQDGDGEWWFHQSKPEKRAGWFFSDNRKKLASWHGDSNPNWRETLERRPEGNGEKWCPDAEPGTDEYARKCYVREGLYEFVERQWPDLKLVPKEERAPAERLHVNIDATGLLETAERVVREAKEAIPFGSEPFTGPDLIIPESVANQLSDEATGSIIYAARENGYRIDIDECGIRGWKGG